MWPAHLETHIGKTNFISRQSNTIGPQPRSEHEQSEHYIVIMKQKSFVYPLFGKRKFAAACYFIRPTPGNQPSQKTTKSHPHMGNQPSLNQKTKSRMTSVTAICITSEILNCSMWPINVGVGGGKLRGFCAGGGGWSKPDFRFFLYCTARQHPAQNTSTRHGQPAPTDIWEGPGQ